MFHGLDRALLAVPDLDGATRETQTLLGRPPEWRGALPEAGLRAVEFRLEGFCLELLAPSGAGRLGAIVSRSLEERGAGLLALGFGVEDAALCAGRLRAAGLGTGELLTAEGSEPGSAARRRWRCAPLARAATRGLPLFAAEEAPGAPPAAVPDAAAVAALDHAVVLSADLEASEALYGGALGLRLALDRSFPERGLRILFFRPGPVTLELVGSVAAPPRPEAPDRFGGLAWRVADVEAARERLRRAGLDVSPARPGAKPGTRVLSLRGGSCGVPTLLIGPELSRSPLPG